MIAKQEVFFDEVLAVLLFDVGPAHSPRKKSQHHPTFDVTLLPTTEHICSAPY